MNEFHDHASDHRTSQREEGIVIQAAPDSREETSTRKSHICFRFLTYDKVENMALHFPDNYDQELGQNPNM